jgi:hypothetical protein
MNPESPEQQREATELKEALRREQDSHRQTRIALSDLQKNYVSVCRAHNLASQRLKDSDDELTAAYLAGLYRGRDVAEGDENNPGEVEEQVVAMIRERRDKGRQKYGTTMERDDLDEAAWLRHAQEEALDLAIYLQRLIRDKKKEVPR